MQAYQVKVGSINNYKLVVSWLVWRACKILNNVKEQMIAQKLKEGQKVETNVYIFFLKILVII